MRASVHSLRTALPGEKRELSRELTAVRRISMHRQTSQQASYPAEEAAADHE